MKRTLPLSLFAPLLACGAAATHIGAPHAPSSALAYPATRTVDEKNVLHGVTVTDPYRWLEDGKSDEVRAWASAQNALARRELGKLPGRDAIAARLRELFYIESVGIPRVHGGRTFFSRRDAGKEKAIVYVREAGGADRVLLDPNAWSKDGSSSLGGWWPTRDGQKIAFTQKVNNSDEATLYVMVVATGAKSAVDVIEGAKYASPSWTPRGDGFYYTWLPTDPAIPVADRPGFAEIRFHPLGADPTKDAVVHPKLGDPKSFLSPGLSFDGRFLFASVSHGWSRTDVYYQDLSIAGAPGWKPLVVGRDAMFDVDAYGGRFLVTTNEGAPRWRVFSVDPAKPERDAWTEIVPERKDQTIEATSIVGGRLAIVTMKDVVSRLEVRELDGKLVREVQLPAIGSASVLAGERDADVAYYSFTSFTYPTEIYETSVKTGVTKLWYRLKSPVTPEKYEVEQLFATSKDGTRVPMFVIHEKGMKRDGSAKTILYGYGGFQSAETPGFMSSIYPWLERGGVYVVANLRGGSEYGEEWHRAGMGHKKQNVFDDFVAVAEHLVKQGYTRPEKLVIRGGSNGGLLVGAALIQRPDLFRVALCGVPLLDMVRYHLFGSGKTWIEEYGSADDAEDFKALFAYSPYHHVKPGTRYPSVLLLSADSDDRVDPMHARKFAAALQSATLGGPVLLRVEQHSGHGGADLVRAAVEKSADEYAFALSETSR